MPLGLSALRPSQGGSPKANIALQRANLHCAFKTLEIDSSAAVPRLGRQTDESDEHAHADATRSRAKKPKPPEKQERNAFRD
eukprot:CAMPEP_0175683824 /NCGR_PEP_ID=MMETSP0097-20121207/26524_1 /TAXON_ID=311494 /ORGANISM="Alexandrium monilatum, Strain CCMP3105" /LENGTH=81 /DNA_ID=CAMNT_0016990741 /DNA_START=198 /DNA_END=440 /DNA_ORIENTATION=+